MAYNILYDGFLSHDREPELSMVFFSVQLLTAPSVATHLALEFSMIERIWCTLSLYLFTTSDGEPLPDILKKIPPGDVQPGLLECSNNKILRSRRYAQMFSDLRYLLHTPDISKVLDANDEIARFYLEFITPFSGIDPNQRQLDVHVEYESESWVNAFNVIIPIAKNSRSFVHALPKDTDVLDRTIENVLKKLCVIYTEEGRALKVA